MSRPPPALSSQSSMVKVVVPTAVMPAAVLPAAVIPAAPMGFPSVAGTSYPVDVGPGLPYPAQPSFLMDQRNNNVPQGSLMHQSQPLYQSHTPYLNEFRQAMGGAPGYYAVMKRSHDESHYPATSKKT